jgi:hypothetical protein
MKDKFLAVITIICLLVIVVCVIVYFEYVVLFFGFVLATIHFIMLTGLAFYILYLLFDKTNKWLTIGLDNHEKDFTVFVLVFIIYGGIIFGIRYLLLLFVGADKVGEFIFKNIIGTILIMIIYGNIVFKIFGGDTIRENFLLFSMIFVSVSVASSITLNYFFGDDIISWFISYWYYLLGVLVLASIIIALYDHFKRKKNQPLD